MKYVKEDIFLSIPCDYFIITFMFMTFLYLQGQFYSDKKKYINLEKYFCNGHIFFSISFYRYKNEYFENYFREC